MRNRKKNLTKKLEHPNILLLYFPSQIFEYLNEQKKSINTKQNTIINEMAHLQSAQCKVSFSNIFLCAYATVKNIINDNDIVNGEQIPHT